MTDAPAEDSILDSTKKALGVDTSYDIFDPTILMHINSVFSTLYQLGVGLTDDQFLVEDGTTKWSDALTTQKNLNMIKSYMYLRVRLLFDPPQTGFATDAMSKQIEQLEWRIMVAASSGPNLVSIPSVPDGTAYVWDLTGLSDFPAEAPVNAVGMDFTTGNVWRKT